MESAVARRYILLRSREGNHAGYARLEVRHGRGTVALRMAVPAEKGPCASCCWPVTRRRAPCWTWAYPPWMERGGDSATGTTCPCPEASSFTTPWPWCRTGPPPPCCSMGRWGRARLPCGSWRTPLPATWPCRWNVPPPGRMRRGPRLPLPRHPRRMLPPAAGNRRFLPRFRPRLTVGALPVLRWPKGLAELPGWYASLPPAAPFDAPGWRFVEVPLAADAPRHPARWASWPAADGCSGWPMPCPAALLPCPPADCGITAGCRAAMGRGYWVRFQTLSPNYAVLPPQQDAYTALP